MACDGRIVYGTTTRYYVGDKEVTKAQFDKRFPAKEIEGGVGGHLPGCWPMASTALAVHPSQIGEAHADATTKGVPTEFTKSGQPIFTDRDHRRRYMKAYGYYDRDAGYGDAQRHSYDGPRVDPKELAERYNWG